MTLSEEDINSLVYFHKYKGDITRWVHWEDKKEIIFQKYPELKLALEQLKLAEITLDAIVDKINRENG